VKTEGRILKAIRQQIVDARCGWRGLAAGVVSSLEFGGMADVWEEVVQVITIKKGEVAK